MKSNHELMAKYERLVIKALEREIAEAQVAARIERATLPVSKRDKLTKGDRHVVALALAQMELASGRLFQRRSRR